MIELDKEDLALLVDLAGFFDLAKRGYTPQKWSAWDNLMEVGYVERTEANEVVPTISGYERVRRIKRSGGSKRKRKTITHDPSAEEMSDHYARHHALDPKQADDAIARAKSLIDASTPTER